MATFPVTAPAIPGPRPLPVFGARGNLVRFLGDPVGHLAMLYRNYGPVAGLVEQAQSSIFAFGPEFNRQVLSNPALFRSPSFLNFPTPAGSAPQILDSGLITMNGAYHKQHRHLMQPAFHKKQVETYRDAMVTITQNILDSWSIGGRVDLAREMQRLTLLVASRTLFGLDTTAEADRLGRMVKQWLGMLFSPAVILAPFNIPGAPYRRMLAHAEYMVATYREMIARKRAAPVAQPDVLATLIQTHDEDGGRLADAELIGHAHNIFVAGHDSSALALTWTLFLLAQHPHILHDLLDELESVLHGEAPTVEQLGRLPLLEAVVKESMRVLTPAVVGRRDSTAPFELGPYRLPAGAVIYISPYVTHRLPELYAEPARFHPERWSSIAPTTYEYLPFGAGPHMCIGATFAMLEIRLVLAMIVQRYRLSLAPGARIDRQIRLFLTPKYGMPMIVAPPDRQFVRAEVRGNIHEMIDLRQR